MAALLNPILTFNTCQFSVMGKFRLVFNLRLGNVMMKFVSDA